MLQGSRPCRFDQARCARSWCLVRVSAGRAGASSGSGPCRAGQRVVTADVGHPCFQHSGVGRRDVSGVAICGGDWCAPSLLPCTPCISGQAARQPVVRLSVCVLPGMALWRSSVCLCELLVLMRRICRYYVPQALWQCFGGEPGPSLCLCGHITSCTASCPVTQRYLGPLITRQ